jgi:RHS repeat-associated protein
MSYQLTERHIYGSSRLGMDTEHVEMIGEQPDTLHRRLGLKQYELSNHLGNVLSVITDIKLPVLAEDGTTIISYTAVVISATDYSAFGVALYGRSWSSESYRYGFDGKEKDNEGMGGGNQTYDYGFRIYNPSLGKFLSVDPLFAGFPWNSCYAFAENRVIDGIDLDGCEYLDFRTALIEFNGSGEVCLNLKNFSQAYQDAWNNFNDYHKRPQPCFDERGVQVGYCQPTYTDHATGKQYIGGVPPIIGSLNLPVEMDGKFWKFLYENQSMETEDAEELHRQQEQNYNNARKRKDGGLDNRNNASKQFKRTTIASRGFLMLELSSILTQFVSGVKQLMNNDEIKADMSALNNQTSAMRVGIGDIREFFENNSVNPEVLKNGGYLNLVRYVITGEKLGSDSRIFEIGDMILSENGMKKDFGMDLPKEAVTGSHGNQDSSCPADKTNVRK